MDHSTVLAAITAALTFVLILVTGFYAWANYRVMRIMQADVRARTEPIPRVNINCGSLVTSVHVRAEHAPMRLIELHAALIIDPDNKDEEWDWVECPVGDPRTISPETPAVFNISHTLHQTPKEWRAHIRYTDLGEALEYNMKLSSKGFSFVQAGATPGPFREWLRRVIDSADEKIEAMDHDEKD